MILALVLVVIMCLFVAGMNFAVWLDDQTKIKNFLFAAINAILGIVNLIALVGRAAQV
jgi:hypothetical protein